MSKQNIEIEVPEGFEAKYNPKTQKIDLVKKDNRPRTWEEFCENYHIKDEYWIDVYSEIRNCRDYNGRDSDRDKNFCTSKEEAEAFLAMMQLRQLRKAWIGDWKDTWEYPDAPKKYVIHCWDGCIGVGLYLSDRRSLSFPTRKMAEEFLECFRDLIEKAKILL